MDGRECVAVTLDCCCSRCIADRPTLARRVDCALNIALVLAVYRWVYVFGRLCVLCVGGFGILAFGRWVFGILVLGVCVLGVGYWVWGVGCLGVGVLAFGCWRWVFGYMGVGHFGVGRLGVGSRRPPRPSAPRARQTRRARLGRHGRV